MLTTLLFVAVCLLAYANGANDNFKGVASLFGSNTTSYRNAITWATITTLAGSVTSFVLAQELLKRFSARGLVPDALAGSEAFLLAVALGAGLTVMLATLTGFPISTTHGLTGAIAGAGLIAVGSEVNFATLYQAFFLPLVLSPFLAVVVGGALYLLFRFVRLRWGVTKEWCMCVGQEQRLVPMPQPGSVLAATPLPPSVSVALDTESNCAERYAGSVLGVSCQRLVDTLHYLSAGVVSFARGLNDTPKIAALLLVVQAFDIRWGILAVALTMAVGGLLSARRVAETMAHKITTMNAGQAFSANLATGLLVIVASRFGMPVSTTHVAVGALFGVGLITRQANYQVVVGILSAWLVTLPCAALLSAMTYLLLRH